MRNQPDKAFSQSSEQRLARSEQLRERLRCKRVTVFVRFYPYSFGRLILASLRQDRLLRCVGIVDRQAIADAVLHLGPSAHFRPDIGADEQTRL